MSKNKNKGTSLSEEEFQRIIREHDKTGGALAQAGARQAQGCWDSGIKIIQNCGHMNIPEYLIRFSQLAHEKIECLKRAYPSLEWLAYLEGRIDHETHEVFVDDLIIPDSQIVTGGHVGEVEYGWNEGKSICGVIHSHNTMGAFFSGTDDAYINQNHDVSICVSTARGREIKSQVRVKTPCGSYLINEKIAYKIDYVKTLDEKAFVDYFKPRIHEPRVLFRQRPAKTSGKGVQDANSVRGGQPSANLLDGVRPELQLPDSVEDPFGMDEQTIVEELRKFYTDDDVEDMIESDLCLASELETCYEALGLDEEEPEIITFQSEDEEDVDLGEIVVQTEKEWDTGLSEIRTGSQRIKVIQ